MWEAIFFYGFAVVAVASALLMVLMKNPVVSAIYLVVTFFCIAGFFVLLNAQLLAALQVIVYAGAIMVLFLFVIMLLNLNRNIFTSYKLFFTKLFALIVLVAILIIVGSVLGDINSEAAAKVPAPNLDENYVYDHTPESGNYILTLSEVLFTRYIYPFEIIAVMLLAAIIGAVILTKKRT